ncbi:MAG TPA: hypothetical protein VG652_01955 [Gaiellaceae bacterium]|nr:hypothetical protein [Gaiellaceae bacterium]
MRVRLLAASFALTALLAGCGGSSPSTTSTFTPTAETTTEPIPYAPLPNGEKGKFPEQIVTDAIAAATKATTVHITGSVMNQGKPLKLNLDLVTGKGGSGTVSVNGLTFQIVRIGAKAYFKGDTAFWSHFGGTGLGPILNGRWIEASALTGDLASFTPLTDVNELFTSVLGAHGPLLKGSNNVTIDGKPAIGIVDTGQNATLFIAANGAPYPLKLEQSDGGLVTFDNWNAPVSLQAPKGAVELDKLK